MSASDKDVVNAASVKKENIYPVSLQQQKLFMARSGREFEFNPQGYWTTSIPQTSDKSALAKVVEDFERGNIVYGSKVANPATPEFDAYVKRRDELYAENNRLAGERIKHRKNPEKLKSIEQREAVVQAELQQILDSISELESATISHEELLQRELRLTEAQAIGFAHSVQQQLYGYHKRLTGQDSEFDLNDINHIVTFSCQGKGNDAKIIIKLHTKTDPELYSEFEILVSDLTDKKGEPQCNPRAPIKLVYTGDVGKLRPDLGMENMGMEDFLNIPAVIPTGYWDKDGYHYYDEKKNARFNCHQKSVSTSDKDNALKKEQEERQKQKEHAMAKVRREHIKPYVPTIFGNDREIAEDFEGITRFDSPQPTEAKSFISRFIEKVSVTLNKALKAAFGFSFASVPPAKEKVVSSSSINGSDLVSPSKVEITPGKDKNKIVLRSEQKSDVSWKEINAEIDKILDSNKREAIREKLHPLMNTEEKKVLLKEIRLLVDKEKKEAVSVEFSPNGKDQTIVLKTADKDSRTITPPLSACTDPALKSEKSEQEQQGVKRSMAAAMAKVGKFRIAPSSLSEIGNSLGAIPIPKRSH